MSTDNNGSDCSMKCLIAGVLLGLAVLVVSLLATGIGFLMSLVLGIVVAILLTIVLRMVLCVDSDAVGATRVSDTTASSSAPVSPTQSSVPASESAAPAREPQVDRAPDPDPEPEPQVDSTPEPERVAEAPPQTPEPEQQADEAGEAVQPAALQAARDGGPDDLKKIKGIGPKLEQLLHSLGIYHYDQIAAWGPAEVAWMDDNLQGFRGRVTRDDWVAQARRLAAGDETEFSRKVDDGDVY